MAGTDWDTGATEYITCPDLQMAIQIVEFQTDILRHYYFVNYRRNMVNIVFFVVFVLLEVVELALALTWDGRAGSCTAP